MIYSPQELNQKFDIMYSLEINYDIDDVLNHYGYTPTYDRLMGTAASHKLQVFLLKHLLQEIGISNFEVPFWNAEDDPEVNEMDFLEFLLYEYGIDFVSFSKAMNGTCHFCCWWDDVTLSGIVPQDVSQFFEGLWKEHEVYFPEKKSLSEVLSGDSELYNNFDGDCFGYLIHLPDWENIYQSALSDRFWNPLITRCVEYTKRFFNRYVIENDWWLAVIFYDDRESDFFTFRNFSLCAILALAYIYYAGNVLRKGVCNHDALATTITP